MNIIIRHDPSLPTAWVLENLPYSGSSGTEIVEFYDINSNLLAELDNHPTIYRSSYNMWSSKSKEELEEFLTYFTLKYTK